MHFTILLAVCAVMISNGCNAMHNPHPDSPSGPTAPQSLDLRRLGDYNPSSPPESPNDIDFDANYSDNTDKKTRHHLIHQRLPPAEHEQAIKDALFMRQLPRNEKDRKAKVILARIAAKKRDSSMRQGLQHLLPQLKADHPELFHSMPDQPCNPYDRRQLAIARLLLRYLQLVNNGISASEPETIGQQATWQRVASLQVLYLRKTIRFYFSKYANEKAQLFNSKLGVNAKFMDLLTSNSPSVAQELAAMKAEIKRALAEYSGLAKKSSVRAARLRKGYWTKLLGMLQRRGLLNHPGVLKYYNDRLINGAENKELVTEAVARFELAVEIDLTMLSPASTNADILIGAYCRSTPADRGSTTV